MAYLPAFPGEFVWDDDAWTSNIAELLKDLSGLRLIWLNTESLQQYYPLTATSFWLDHHLWGFWTPPYHVENVLLHASSAMLLWWLLARLEVSGAGLAASFFGLHPLMVESVAWITERKAVLSLVLYLAALHCYGTFVGLWGRDQLRSLRIRSYLYAFVLFLGALLAKSTAFSFPAVVLLITWWKRGRLRWKSDLLASIPFFALAIELGIVTAFLETSHVGAQGPAWTISFQQRCLIAGRAFWFYLGKVFWPTGLCFTYPRWDLDAVSPVQWAYPVAAVAVVAGLWLGRRWLGRGPIAAVLFFVGTLFPVLGFMNVYFFRYSFVCDHWTYVPALGLFALCGGLIAHAAERLRVPSLPSVFAAAAVPTLAFLTWQQSGMYVSSETLWRTTLERNPRSFLAHTITGNALLRKGAIDESIPHYLAALEAQSDFEEAHYNLGAALTQKGLDDEAVDHFRKALNPHRRGLYPLAVYSLASALFRKGEVDEAILHYQQVVALKPLDPDAHSGLALALIQKGRNDEALGHLRVADALSRRDPFQAQP